MNIFSSVEKYNRKKKWDDMFKNKQYWILMPPFLILTIVLFTFTDNNIYGFSVIITFWFIYYTWNYIEKKKQTKN